MRIRDFCLAMTRLFSATVHLKVPQTNVFQPNISWEVSDLNYSSIFVQTTLPNFSSKNFSVRRRYSEFVWLRDHIRQKMDEKGKRLTIADLPGNTISSFFGSGALR